MTADDMLGGILFLLLLLAAGAAMLKGAEGE